MILLDFSQIAISNVIVQKITDPHLIRHQILNSIRMYNKKYREKYGQMVICADGRNAWRRDFFPEYKASRRESRKDDKSTGESGINWDEVFQVMNQLLIDLKDHFPYKVVHIDGCEGDDIIGALTIQTQHHIGMSEPIMIISSDKDFLQLHRYDNVEQFSPIQKKVLSEKHPRAYLFEHVCRGDSGDGVPNILSDDDTFIHSEKRQTPLRKKKLEMLASVPPEKLRDYMSDEEYRNYQRNTTLIDLREIPSELYDTIIDTYYSQKLAPKMKVMNYLVKNRLKNLVECTGDFYNEKTGT